MFVGLGVFHGVDVVPDLSEGVLSNYIGSLEDTLWNQNPKAKTSGYAMYALKRKIVHVSPKARCHVKRGYELHCGMCN